MDSIFSNLPPIQEFVGILERAFLARSLFMLWAFVNECCENLHGLYMYNIYLFQTTWNWDLPKHLLIKYHVIRHNHEFNCWLIFTQLLGFHEYQVTGVQGTSQFCKTQKIILKLNLLTFILKTHLHAHEVIHFTKH